jgi:hypothetical protein
LASKPFPSNHELASADVNDLVGVYARSTNEVDVVNTTTETALYSKTITGGHLASDRAARVTIAGDYLGNTGGQSQFTLRVKLGGTTVFEDISGLVTDNAARRPFHLVATFQNLGSVSSQFLSGLFVLGPPSSATTGLGDLEGNPWRVAPFTSSGASSVNTAVDVVLAVTVQWTAANSSRSFRKKHALLELL